jgi:hypothetical protein
LKNRANRHAGFLWRWRGGNNGDFLPVWFAAPLTGPCGLSATALAFDQWAAFGPPFFRIFLLLQLPQRSQGIISVVVFR